jgi:hypothetical protein
MAYGLHPLITNADMDSIACVDCEFTEQTTSSLYIDRTGAFGITGLDLIRCKFKPAATADGGAAASFQYVTGKAHACEFDGPTTGAILNAGSYSNGGSYAFTGGSLTAVGPAGMMHASNGGGTISATTRQTPAPAGAQTLVRGPLYGQAALVQDAANTAYCFVPLGSDALDFNKVVLTGTLRRAAGDAYPAATTAEPTWAFADASTIRVRFIMGEANAAGDYRFSYDVVELA